MCTKQNIATKASTSFCGVLYTGELPGPRVQR